VFYCVSNNNTIAVYGPNYLSLMPSGEQQLQPFSYINDDICTALILEEAEKLYNELITKLTNSVIAAKAVAVRASPLSLSPSNSGS
jgi:hypothetical protein